MRINILYWFLPIVCLIVCLDAFAQPTKKLYRIGSLTGTRETDAAASNTAVLLKTLLGLGYIEGQNLVVERRNSGGKVERFPTLAAEFVNLKVDVIVATNPMAIRAAKDATKTIPIVMITSVDPVANGIIDSLAHPGGNITGVSILARDLSGKRLELLREIVPTISRVGILVPGDATISSSDLKGYESAASALKLRLQSLEVSRANPDFPALFANARVDAAIALRNSLINSNAKLIANLAIKKRLPLMFERGAYVESGGLVSYANSDSESFQRAAVLVDKIFKGAKPADIPVEQPLKFEFVINLKAAKAIGLTIPPNVLVRANRVIR